MMHIESFRDYCLSLDCTEEGMPFDDKVLVFKVLGKMFALCDIDKFESINLKCNPERAIELRESYPAVQKGYHMSKKHWNTVLMDGSISDKLLKEWIDHSYDCVVAGMPKKVQAELKKDEG